MAYEVHFPDQGLDSGPPALGAQCLSHWTIREVPTFKKKNYLFFAGFKLLHELFSSCGHILLLSACGCLTVVVSLVAEDRL